jgi:hypothetical protein
LELEPVVGVVPPNNGMLELGEGKEPQELEVGEARLEAAPPEDWVLERVVGEVLELVDAGLEREVGEVEPELLGDVV